MLILYFTAFPIAQGERPLRRQVIPDTCAHANGRGTVRISTIHDQGLDFSGQNQRVDDMPEHDLLNL